MNALIGIESQSIDEIKTIDVDEARIYNKFSLLIKIKEPEIK